MKKFHIIYLYGEPSTENLQVKELGEYLKGKLPGLKTEVRQDFFFIISRGLRRAKWRKE